MACSTLSDHNEMLHLSAIFARNKETLGPRWLLWVIILKCVLLILSQTQRGPKCDCVCVASGVWYRISWLQRPSWLAICKTRIVNEIRGNKSLVDCAEGKVCESQDFNARMRGYRIPWEKSPHKSSRFSPEYYTSDKFLVPSRRTRGKKKRQKSLTNKLVFEP